MLAYLWLSSLFQFVVQNKVSVARRNFFLWSVNSFRSGHLDQVSFDRMPNWTQTCLEFVSKLINCLGQLKLINQLCRKVPQVREYLLVKLSCPVCDYWACFTPGRATRQTFLISFASKVMLSCSKDLIEVNLILKESSKRRKEEEKALHMAGFKPKTS